MRRNLRRMNDMDLPSGLASARRRARALSKPGRDERVAMHAARLHVAIESARSRLWERTAKHGGRREMLNAVGAPGSARLGRLMEQWERLAARYDVARGIVA